MNCYLPLRDRQRRTKFLPVFPLYVPYIRVLAHLHGWCFYAVVKFPDVRQKLEQEHIQNDSVCQILVKAGTPSYTEKAQRITEVLEKNHFSMEILCECAIDEH